VIRVLRELRLIPFLLIGTACLFALKLLGLMFNGNYVLSARGLSNDHPIVLSLAPSTQELAAQTIPLETGTRAQPARPSWMQEMFGFPDVTGSVSKAARAAPGPDIATGSVATPKPAAKDSTEADKTAAVGGGRPPTPETKPPMPETKPPMPETKPPMPETKPAGVQIQLDGNRPLSAAERAILERLQQRRLELERRARELDMRENMLKEAEARLKARMNELKEQESRNGGSALKRQDSDAARFKSLAAMYENMKPKDAARIFDRLDIKVLVDMASLINPRRMSDILAQMSPEAAERLTNELANRASGVERAVNPAALPKIEGRPSGS
jgi:flagellar motility protein MotE (MotC chaperone)